MLLGVLLVVVGGQLLFFGMMAELIIHRTAPLRRQGIVAQVVGGMAQQRQTAGD